MASDHRVSNTNLPGVVVGKVQRRKEEKVENKMRTACPVEHGN